MTRPRRRRPGAVKKPTAADLAGRERHPLRIGAVGQVNRSFDLTTQQRQFYNQGASVTCVAFSTSQLMTLLNGGELYHPGWLFYRAQEIDGIPGEAGTTTDAALRVLKALGHVAGSGDVASAADLPGAEPDQADGIDGFAWVPRTPDPALEGVRACVAAGAPVLIASPWYSSFGEHEYEGSVWMVPPGADWGDKGGMWHQYLIDGAFDDGEYLTTPNSWGFLRSARIPYDAFKRLTNEGAYCATVVDRGGTPVPAPDDDREPKARRRRRRRRRRR